MTDNDDPWHRASTIVRPMGSIAGNFAAAVRSLLLYHEQGTSTLSAGVQTHMLRLLRNSTVKASYYFGSLAYRPSKIQNLSSIKPRDFLNLYQPFEHAVLLSYCYLFRALAKKSNKEEWEYVQSPLYESLEIGACIGNSIPQVGFGIGLLARGFRYLAFAPFLMNDHKGFVQYRRHLRSKDLPFDEKRELEIWGCTNIHVAALLMEYMGFNHSVAHQFVAAAEKNTSINPDAKYGVSFRAAEALIDSFTESGEIPERLPSWTGSSLVLTKDQRSQLVSDLNRALGSSHRIEWLNKNSSSLSPSTTPQLFDVSAAVDGSDAAS
jgi:hypothetical protein